MRTPASTLIAALLALPLVAQAEVKSEAIAYQDGDTQLQGYLYYDDAISGKRPGVIVVHEWWGLNDYAKHRAEMLAKLGYAAFALDMYGDNKVTTHAKDAKGWSTQITENTDAWRRRALAGLDALKADARVDPEHLAAVGYCFGGSTVMQMAYAGADLDGVVSFHGSLPTPAEGEGTADQGEHPGRPRRGGCLRPTGQGRGIQGRPGGRQGRLGIHLLRRCRPRLQQPGCGSYGIDNIRYDERADRRSWATMQAFLERGLDPLIQARTGVVGARDLPGPG